ncbi:uncharacterized protein LOC128551870 [Mercenaria mercenaria]|uniref:uncharacterized protein LOC128551870 n=1 Tax=Mercenaria mercenaria TaxID=6596 RepID=UPI00234F1A6A|nr:uncharacterized protein LOC128551870 [Mercenaria mercenaria]
MHFRILCLLTLIRIFPNEASVYYEYPDHATWTEAKNSCSLALPVFWNDLGQKVVNVTNNITTDLWVGYFKASTGFEYKGCIRNENYTLRMDSERITIGQCYSACGRKQMIGISGRKCYCEDQFNFKEGIKSRICYKCRNCPANVSNTCDENSCLSVYKVNQNVTKDQKLNIYDNMCLKFAGKEIVFHNRYTWTDCKQQYKAFCEYGMCVCIS